MTDVRVRFAPSPTGPLHIGGVRTALYNYLFAKKMGGTMILRIEDTDQTRYVPGAEDYIIESLDWIGIKSEENPVVGGPYGPYRQSERKAMYGEYAQKLIDEGNAYYAFDTPEELDAMRERLKAGGVHTPQYNGLVRQQMENSLTLPADEVKAMIDGGEPYVVRLKVPLKDEIRLQDMVRDWVHVHSNTIDDKILLKSDGMPTYHLANVVDDHLMKITHVIRGEEWLPSAPLHVLLYRFLGWEDTMPQFAHLPLLLKPDGNGKLSKRDADKHGFPLYPMQWTDPKEGTVASGFRESGYLPEALLNFLAFLGWNPGTEQELFTFDELVDSFSIDRIQKGGAKFDIQKAQWYNQQYLKQLSNAELGQLLLEQLKTEGIEASPEKAEAIANNMKERITYTSDLWTEAKYFHIAPIEYDEKTVRKKWNETAVNGLKAFTSALASEGDLTPERAKEVFSKTLEDAGLGFGKVMPALRISLTGQAGGPDLMEIMAILGREEVIQRIETAITRLQENV
ncbi:MAG TPA: glutamate--tRNA ligase [Cytophagales bacterium]|nr:glutamate--tRNA ligase [Cytophagales bacterium]